MVFVMACGILDDFLATVTTHRKGMRLLETVDATNQRRQPSEIVRAASNIVEHVAAISNPPLKFSRANRHV